MICHYPPRFFRNADSAPEAILALSCPIGQARLNQSRASGDAMPNENQGIDLFEIIKTTRSMRRLKPDPVPNELIRKILEVGVCAPSGGNMQRWRFLLIRDPKVKETVGALYKRAWDEQVAPRYRSGEPAPGTSRERFERMLAAAEYLAAHIHEAPVWIVPCLEAALRPVRRARRFIQRCRTCCSPREPSASGRL